MLLTRPLGWTRRRVHLDDHRRAGCQTYRRGGKALPPPSSRASAGHLAAALRLSSKAASAALEAFLPAAHRRSRDSAALFLAALFLAALRHSRARRHSSRARHRSSRALAGALRLHNRALAAAPDFLLTHRSRPSSWWGGWCRLSRPRRGWPRLTTGWRRLTTMRRSVLLKSGSREKQRR